MLELITEDTKKTVEVCTSLKDERRAFAGRKNELAGRMRPAGRGLDKPALDILNQLASGCQQDLGIVNLKTRSY
ncbi:hypothetical protein M8J77_024720 [Diaphorina citri]|nr:hypothetical protein M8J77_024720 [Diaphorina citri]